MAWSCVVHMWPYLYSAPSPLGTSVERNLPAMVPRVSPQWELWRLPSCFPLMPGRWWKLLGAPRMLSSLKGLGTPPFLTRIGERESLEGTRGHVRFPQPCTHCRSRKLCFSHLKTYLYLGSLLVSVNKQEGETQKYQLEWNPVSKLDTLLGKVTNEKSWT